VFVARIKILLLLLTYHYYSTQLVTFRNVTSTLQILVIDCYCIC